MQPYIERAIVPDEIEAIKHEISRICDELNPALLLTTGGTGLSPRDVTPEATALVIERMYPGISEAMRTFSLTKTKRAMLSRGISGILGSTLIINLPGSPKAATECLEFIMEALPHGLEVLTGTVRNCAESNT